MSKAWKYLARCSTVMATLVVTAAPTPVMAQQSTYNFDIPSQNLDKALARFGRITKRQLVFNGGAVRNLRSRSINGRFTAEDGLSRLLQGSGFAARVSPTNVFIIEAARAPVAVETPVQRRTEAPKPAAAREDDQSASNEITVTATKRETTLQETAIAVSVVGEQAIDKRGLVGMDDYLAGLPGVSYQDRGAGSNTITIRGIGLGSQLDPNSPVGSYFGEVPVTGLGPPANGNQAGNADIKLVDVKRVEILRGPQGTLYGSGTMGGTVRIIPNSPNLQEAEGRVSAEYSYTGRSGGHNYSVEAVANAPLIEDKLALRMVAYRFENSGWIDNVPLTNPTPRVTAAVNLGALRENRERVGGDTYAGARATMLWRPTADLSLTLSHTYQEIRQDGFREVQTGLSGRYQQSRVKVGENGADDEYVNLKLAISNAVVGYDFGWGSLINSTSLIDSESEAEVELTFFGAPFIGESSYRESDKEILVNEFRFTSDFNGPFQVLAGLYYEDRQVVESGAVRWAAPPPAPAGAFFQAFETTTTQKQVALFGEAAFTPIDPLTLTVGARYFKFTQGRAETRTGRAPLPYEESSIDGINWKANLSYKISDQLFAYGQWSQGFREPRFQITIIPQMDADNDGLVEFRDGIERKVTEGLLDPDTVDNYEIGLKYRSRDGRFQGAITGFLIDWKGIPVVPSLTAFLGGAIYFNAGKAQAKGIEFEATLQPIDDLFLDVSASWVNSELTESMPGLGNKGAALPGSADYNVHAGVEKRFTVGSHKAFVRGDYTYVSEYHNSLAETGAAAGGYHLFDLAAGITIDRVKVGLFVKNLTNRDDFTWIDNAFSGSDRAYRLRPRTIGINLGTAF